MPQTSPLQVTLSGAGNPLRCREEAPGGGLLRREAAGGAAAVLTSPSRYQLSGSGGSGGGQHSTRPMKVGALEQGGRVESTPSLTSSSLLFPFPPSSTLPGPQRSLSLC
ncbi:unnamed protein product [Closterium sp. NIES-64]|nr:unnamed protein product [Closterium sp. NIES-64]